MCVYLYVKSHSGACEDKQRQREENDTNQLKHYCLLYSRLIRLSQGAGEGFIDTSTQTQDHKTAVRGGLDAAWRAPLHFLI